jgi:hypothetical protein
MPAGAQLVAAAPPAIRSTFQSSKEGWKVVGDPAAGSPARVQEGSNWFLRTVDSGGGSAMYWSAPAKFLGEKTAYSGGLLEFDLRQGSSAQQLTTKTDVVLVGNGLSLTYNLDLNPETVWTTYYVALWAGTGWMKGSSPAAQSDIDQALQSVTALKIRAEYSQSLDTDGIDDVRLSTDNFTLPVIESNFDRTVEGWDATGDYLLPPERAFSGGHPGPFIWLDDKAIGGIMYWQAPDKFLGNQSRHYGGELSFWLRQNPAIDDAGDFPDVVLTGSGVKQLFYDLPLSPKLKWTRFRVPLEPGSRWSVGQNGPVPTPDEMRGVLSDLTGLAIRAEYRHGDEVDGLDSVTFGPEISVHRVTTSEDPADGDTAKFVLTLSPASSSEVKVLYEPRDGSAKLFQDYLDTAEIEAIFFPGETETIVEVPIVNDDVAETVERFTLRLSDPVNAGLGVASAECVILDDD